MGRSETALVASGRMGRNKSNKQNPTAKTEKENTTNFVPIVACNYCDSASFDVNDRTSYSDHLKKAHTIQKNIESLMDLTLNIQTETKDEPIQDEDANAVTKPSGISLPMTGSSNDWMDDDVGLTIEDEDEDNTKAEETTKV